MVTKRDGEWLNKWGDRIRNPEQYFDKVEYNKEHGITPTGGDAAVDRAIARYEEEQYFNAIDDSKAQERGFSTHGDYMRETSLEERIHDFGDESEI
jgi:hypothetical protein